MSTNPIIPGIEYTFANGETLTVPPMALGDVETMQERLDGFAPDMSLSSIKTVIDATHKALVRNYPHITREHVAMQLLDVSNMLDVMQAIMDVGGFRRKSMEAEKQGEAKPGA